MYQLGFYSVISVYCNEECSQMPDPSFLEKKFARNLTQNLIFFTIMF